MKKSILFILVFSVIYSGGAWAVDFATTGNPGDTLAGTRVTAEGTNNRFNYRDTAANDRPTVYGSTLEVVTGTDVGFSIIQIPAPPTYYLSATPGSTETWSFALTNEGNARLTLTTTLSSVSVSSGGSGWSASLWSGSTNYGSSLVTTIEEDSELSSAVELRITPATTESGSPDESVGTVEVMATTGYAGGATYYGANELTYGGMDTVSPTKFGATVQAPVISISRTATVDSPSTYTNWGDGPHAFAPGSLWTFTISYSNEGTGNATNVVISDKVPSNCTGYKFNVQEPEDNVNVTAAYETSAGWIAYYSTDANPGLTFDASGWTLVGTLEAATTELDIPAAATYVKWQKEGIVVGDNATLQWSVYLK